MSRDAGTERDFSKRIGAMADVEGLREAVEDARTGIDFDLADGLDVETY